MNQSNRKEEIKSRLESNEWNSLIANQVSKRYEKKVRQNRIITGIVFSIFIFISGFTVFTTDMFQSDTINLQALQFIFSDGISPLLDAFYQEENISFFNETLF